MWEQFKQVPRGFQILMGVMGTLGLGGLVAAIDRRAIWIVLGGIVVIGLLIALWKLFELWQQRRRARELAGQLGRNSASAPMSVVDPAKRAKLDDLRQNFTRGLEKFRAAGKDIYSLPWYLVVGEPGSGKTEAVRHCNVGFPPGLQDEMQGAGGTINMHWWFTNQAILLDTAGKMLFSEAPPGQTSEWTEFLALLKKNRANCPVNGLLLVIPSESLIRDSADEIQRKAGKIARQFDTIQRALDVRFPVFLLITKCDLINGFREFFAGIKDPQLQHQMMGWSNPSGLDEPFQADKVDAHLGQVIDRVKRRRLGLMRDPVAESGNGRRIDEVDALFALPQSLQQLSVGLRRYLETIFVAGEWASKPLFLRGIYFTSALTEGTALDLEIAQAMGMPVENLPEGKIWERERSFFLRDLFVQKVFREKGLVTRATNTRHVVRKRQIVLGAAAGVGLLGVVLLSLIGAQGLRRSVGAETDVWSAATEGWQGEGADAAWSPLVTPEFRGASRFVYNGSNPVELGDSSVTVVAFHAQLRDLVTQSIDVPWVFRPVSSLVAGLDRKRREAQRVLYETGVVGPLVRSARARLESTRDSWTPEAAGQLAVLVYTEGLIHYPRRMENRPEMLADDFFGPLLQPITPERPKELYEIFDWLYGPQGRARDQWPPVWLSAGKSFRENRAINGGWESFQGWLKSGQKRQESGLALIRDLQAGIAGYRTEEELFLREAAGARTAEGWRPAVESRFERLIVRRDAVVAAGEALRAGGFGGTGVLTLAGATKSVIDGVREQNAASFRAVQEVLRRFGLGSGRRTELPNPDFTLLRDIESRLVALDRDLVAQAESFFNPGEQLDFPLLDQAYLAPVKPDSDTAHFDFRWAAYRDGIFAGNARLFSGALVGGLADAFTKQAAIVGSLRERADAYEGTLRTDFQRAARNLADYVAQQGPANLVAAHSSEFEDLIRTKGGFPLTLSANEREARPPLPIDGFREWESLLRRAQGDMSLAGIPASSRAEYDRTSLRLRRMGQFASALLGEGGEPQSARVFLLRFEDQQKGLMARFGGGRTFASLFAGNVFRSMRVGSKALRTGVGENVELFKVGVAESLPGIELFTTPDPRPQADAVIPGGQTWGILRAILEGGAVRRNEGREFEIALPVRISNQPDRFVLLNVVFDRPLPEVEQWPAIGVRRQ